jgi:hypothetical protein
VYVAYQNSQQGTRGVINASTTKPCGNGLIDFDITSVKLEILTTLDSSANGGIDIGPIVSGGGTTFAAGVGAGRSISNTQELVLATDLLPNRAFAYAGTETVESAPIAGSLINLRNALIKAAEIENRVCFKTTQNAKVGNTYKIAISVEESTNGDIELGLAPLIVTTSGENKSTTGNTLTVSFEPHVFTSEEVAGVRQRGSRGTNPDVGVGGTWSTPITRGTSKSERTGNPCAAGSTAKTCQGTFGRGAETQ